MGDRTGARRVRYLLLVIVLITWGCGNADDPKEDRSEPPTVPRQAASRRAPNLVVITLDTTRADALGLHGQQRPTSPEIDAMAREGTAFMSALASAPLTLPSHATIFSGKHPYAHGVRSNMGYVLSDANVMLAEILRGRGYRTSAEVATDVLRRETGIDQGFDTYRGPKEPGVELKRVKVKGSNEIVTRPIRTGSDITRKGIEFIRANRDRKFFLWLHYFDAHQPWIVPVEHRNRIPDSLYHAAVAYEDELVGRILSTLEEFGLRDNTLVVLTADHGEGLGEHGEETHSYFVYDTTMHVPLVFWGPKNIPRGRSHTDVVRTADIFPTILEFLGFSPPRDIQGVSLLPLITGRVESVSLLGYGESFEAASFFGLSPIRFVRDGRWKYIHKVNPELYDVETDPHELTNRNSERPEIASRLRGRLEELLEDSPARPADSTMQIDPEMQARLQALGYVSNETIPADFDEVASLDVGGADPVSKIETLRAITNTMALLESHLYDEALSTLLPLVEENPESPFILSRLAETRTARKEYSEAIAAYRRVLGITPCDERALTESNRLLKLTGDYETLIDTLRRSAEACPDFAGNLNNYAWALATLPRADLRDGDTAVSIAERALELMHRRDPGFLDTLAVALAEAGRFVEAIQIQSEALRIARASGSARELIDVLQRHLDAFREGHPIRSPEPAAAETPDPDVP